MKKITVVKKMHAVPKTAVDIANFIVAELKDFKFDKIEKIVITAEETKIHKVSEIE